MTLPLALLVVFPFGLEFATGELGFGGQLLAGAWQQRVAAVFLQVLYAWMMTFALMGLFRRLLSRESKTMRYLSDSSYWLYLAHLPLIFLAQAAVRSWPLPPSVKFLLVCGVITAILLVSYEKLVRYTWLGTMLNGPRSRPQPAEEVFDAEVVGA